MAAWWIYGEDRLGQRWFEYVPHRKFYAYVHIRRLTDTRGSFNGGRAISPGAYEFSTYETRQRGQRWFVFTRAGALHLVEAGTPVDALMLKYPHRAASPLKEQFRAS